MRVHNFPAGALAIVLAVSAMAGTPAGAAGPSGAISGDDPVQYVQNLIADMVAVSKLPTADRRKFYVQVLSQQIDWNGPAVQALGERWTGMSASDHQKLADWARDAVIGASGVMEFIQNLIFHSCAILGRGQENSGLASIRIGCSRFGNEPNFLVRLDIERKDQGFRIEDVGYVGISLRDELSKEILKPDAVQKHGVQVGSAAGN